MTTFLEYVATELFGPPDRTNGNGESFWPCPECEHHSFHTMPHRPEYKDRVKCWSCGLLEDVAGLVKVSFPAMSFYGYDGCLDFLATLEKQYKRKLDLYSRINKPKRP